MKRQILFLFICLVLITSIQVNGKSSMKKKAILVVSFGTSYEETRKKTIEACEEKIASQFKNYTITRAFTSNIIRKILKKEYNLEVYSVEEALNNLKANDVKEVIIQPLHIIPGEEYNEKIVKPAMAFKDDFKKLKIGTPLLNTIDDYDAVIDVLKENLPSDAEKNQAVILMGHGTHHSANSSYSCLQMKMYENMPNVFVATVEGYPVLDTIMPQLQENNIKNVVLMPFMLVAGDHANNDMAGDEKDSWKSILQKHGYNVTVILKGLGEYPGIQDIYVSHVKNTIKNN